MTGAVVPRLVPPDQLTQKVLDKVSNRTDKRVFIKADARAKYGVVVQVVDNVRGAEWTSLVCSPSR